MTETAPQDLIDRLDRLLEKERAALLAGDLAQITGILTDKEALIDALNALTIEDRSGLKVLQGKVARNQILLDGALHGIRNVATRLAALRRIRRSLETYDASGRKQTIQGEVTHKMEKRA